jgi:Ca2+-binding RTX toxin-like protein
MGTASTMVFDVGMRNTRRLAASLSLAFIALASVACTADASVVKDPICDGKRANIVGTAGKDSFIPSKFEPGDVVALLGGNDYAQVGGHVDDVTICGGKGEDEIVGDAGAGEGLKFFGDGGADELGSLFEQGKRSANHGFKLDGGLGHDIVAGSKGHDRIEGGSGPDYVRGSSGGDVVHGGPGDDDLSGGPGKDELFGDQDDDRLYGYFYETKTPNRERVDTAFGGPGRDLCVAKHRHSCKKDRR